MPRLKLRRKTAADWVTANPVLAEGEPGYEKDTKNLKVGDGVTTWNLLPYANDQRLATANPTGIVTTFAGSTSPSGWLMCDGTAISRDTYSALFTAIGTTYGVGDGSTTFNLPDLRSKIPVGKAASGTFGTLGGFTGAETVTLAVGNLPSHAHNIDHGHTANSHTHSIDHGHTENSHVHTNDHDHGSVTSSGGTAHGHTGTTNDAGGHAHQTAHHTRGVYDVSGSGWAAYHPGADPFPGGDPTDNEPDHGHTFTTSTESSHTHNVDLPNYTGNTGGTTPTINNHTGNSGGATPTVNNHTGNSGSIGSGTPTSIIQPSLVMNYIIKT